MGLFNWASKKVSNSASKTKTFARKISSADELEKNGQYIVGMVKELSSTPEVVRHETFESAYQRLGLDEEALKTSHDYYATLFNIFLFFFILGTSLGVWYAINLSPAVFAIIGFLAICSAHLFKSSFRMMQIRKRELLPVSYWLAKPSEWWPTAFVVQPRQSSRSSSSSHSRVSSSSTKLPPPNSNRRPRD